MKILAVGDIHLGRSLPVLPHDLMRKNELWLDNTLNNILKIIEQYKIDAVLLTGDVIEKENDRFEVLPILVNFIGSLSANNIQVLAIAGNHDIEALPRIKKLVPDMKILGAEGIWENYSLENESKEKVNIIGLSHSPLLSNTENVFDSFNEALIDRDNINIGLLHCTLGNAPLKYMPVQKENLLASDIELWLLGHIHKPDVLTRESKYGYLGSVSGLDISEKSCHGIKLIEIDGKVITDIKNISVASLRWEHIEIDLSEIDTSDNEEFKDCFVELVQKEINKYIGTFADELIYTKVIGVRLFLKGCISKDIGKEVFSEFSDFNIGSLPEYNCEVFIEKCIDNTYPNIDLKGLAKQKDPAGIIAELYFNINEDLSFEEKFKDFIYENTNFSQRKQLSAFLKEDDAKKYLKESCLSNISELLNQKPKTQE